MKISRFSEEQIIGILKEHQAGVTATDLCRKHGVSVTMANAAVVDASLAGERVASGLDRIAEIRGYPCMVVSDKGTELISNAILKWQEDRKVDWHYIAPGKRMQNGFVRSRSGGLCICPTEGYW